MSNKALGLSVVAAMVAVSAFSEQERVIHVQNNLRVGYDDNVYLNTAEEDSAEIIDVLNISGKLNFSSRSDAVFSYQPEVRYRPDADPKTISYQDAYARLNHAASERVFLTLSDRFRYQLRDAQAGTVNRTDANYIENNLMGSADVELDQKSSIKLGAGYEIRIWDDSNYGEWNPATMTGGNNFDHYSVNAAYYRELKETTKGMVGLDYQDYEYEGSRGSLDAVSAMVGADHTFNPELTGFGRVGLSKSTVDAMGGSDDSTSPYLDAGLIFNPTERTSFNGSCGYTVTRADNSVYNSQDRFRLAAGVRHDLTSKVSVASTLSYVMSWYDATTAVAAGAIDAEDSWMQWSVRGSYQINRNNFVELGYDYSTRTIDAGGKTDWDRNRIDIGWRLRL